MSLNRVAAMASAAYVASAAAMPGERDFAKYTYEDYRQEFDKNNLGAEEHSLRKATFLDNLEKIREHNADQSNTFYMTVNEFAD